MTWRSNDARPAYFTILETNTMSHQGRAESRYYESSALMARLSSLFLRTRQQYQTMDCIQAAEMGHGAPDLNGIKPG